MSRREWESVQRKNMHKNILRTTKNKKKNENPQHRAHTSDILCSSFPRSFLRARASCSLMNWKKRGKATSVRRGERGEEEDETLGMLHQKMKDANGEGEK